MIGLVGNAPELIRKLKPQTASKGSKVEFTCEVDLGKPVSEIVWERQGRPVKVTDRVQQVLDGSKATLIINECSIDDVGTYSMRASNKLGTVETEATLSVTCKSTSKIILYIAILFLLHGVCCVARRPHADL